MIETRKNDIGNRTWSIRVNPEARRDEKGAGGSGARSNTKNVAKATNLLKYPDGVHPFDLWIRMWLEQLLVFDAPCFYPVKSMTGDCFACGWFPGQPLRRFSISTASFLRRPIPAYQQIILGIPTSNLARPGVQRGDAEKVQPGARANLFIHPQNPRVD